MCILKADVLVQHREMGHHSTECVLAVCRCPQSSCLDVLILYHEDDAHMLIDNGGLDSALDNLIGVRNFYILSARNATLR